MLLERYFRLYVVVMLQLKRLFRRSILCDILLALLQLQVCVDCMSFCSLG